MTRIWFKCDDCECTWFSDGQSYNNCPECGSINFNEIEEEQL